MYFLHYFSHTIIKQNNYFWNSPIPIFKSLNKAQLYSNILAAVLVIHLYICR